MSTKEELKGVSEVKLYNVIDKLTPEQVHKVCQKFQELEGDGRLSYKITELAIEAGGNISITISDSVYILK